MKNSPKTGGYLHILKYTGLFGGVQGLNVLIGIVRNKLVAVLLGPQGVGLISLFNTTVRFISDSTNFGLSMSAVRNISEDYDRKDEEKLKEGITLVRSWSLLTALLGFFVCIILSPLLSKYTFSWNGHTLHFILLAPVVALTALSGGELAILKAVRKLRSLAVISVLNVLFALVLTVPLYYFFRNVAIVPSLIFVALVQMILTILVSYRLYPLRVSLRWTVLSKGWGMIRLGTAFVIAGILGSGADLLIRSYLNNVADIEAVGFYNSAYMMTMVYAGMVFSAMETDYFPRLSGVNNLKFTFNQTVNRQVEVTLLLISPLLSLLESAYDVVLVVLVIIGFRQWGILGAGVGIALTGFLHFILVYVYAHHHYAYRMSTVVLFYAFLQLTLGILVFFCVRSDVQWIRWGVASVLCCASSVVSLRVIKSKTGMWNTLVSKIRNKFSRS